MPGKLSAGPTGNTYTVLKSLDLVCDESQEKQLWCRAVCNNHMIAININASTVSYNI